MLLQTIRYRERRKSAYSLRMLLLVIAVAPVQLIAQSTTVSEVYDHSVKFANRVVPNDCVIEKHACCRRLLLKLSLADYKVGYLSGNLTRLQQTLTDSRSLFSDAMGQVALTNSDEQATNVVSLLKIISLTATKIVRTNLAIGSVRSELIMANYNRATAKNAVSAIAECLGVPEQTIQSAR